MQESHHCVSQFWRHKTGDLDSDLIRAASAHRAGKNWRSQTATIACFENRRIAGSVPSGQLRVRRVPSSTQDCSTRSQTIALCRQSLRIASRAWTKRLTTVSPPRR